MWYYRESTRKSDSSGKRQGKSSLEYNWRELHKIIRDLLAKFESQGFKPTLRQLHYALVSLDVFPNLKKSYNALSNEMSKRRHQGYYSMNCVVDERHPIVDISDTYYAPGTWTRHYINKLRNLQNDYHENDNGFPRWAGQPNYVEIWTEKQAMVTQLKLVVRKENLQVRIAPFGGFPGDTELHEHIEERIRMQIGKGKNVYILWFGDFDPSGDAIDKTTFGRMMFDDPWNLEEYALQNNVEFKLLRVALTKEQIHEHKLPHKIERLNKEEQEKIQNDPRHKEFEEKQGDYVCEVDSLPVVVFQTFNDMVVRSVNQYFDNEIYQRGLGQHKEEFPQEEIDDNVYENISTFLEELRVKIMWRWLENLSLRS